MESPIFDEAMSLKSEKLPLSYDWLCSNYYYSCLS